MQEIRTCKHNHLALEHYSMYTYAGTVIVPYYSRYIDELIPNNSFYLCV